jgi:hypothetical protein
MLAPTRGVELFQGVRTIAAAMDPTAAPRRGLSAANQIGFVFMLLSQALRDRHFTKREFLSRHLA